MANLISDFCRFVWAVVSRWQAYVTSSLFAAVAFVYEHVSRKMISETVVLWGIGGFFLTGTFMAWREQAGKVRALTGATEVEALDDLIVEWGELEELYAGDSVVGHDKLDVLIRNTRTQLRANCPSYVNAFNEAVKNPQPSQLFPTKGRTLAEFGEWMKDKDRHLAWQIAAACLKRLREIRKNITSKLPL